MALGCMKSQQCMKCQQVNNFTANETIINLPTTNVCSLATKATKQIYQIISAITNSDCKRETKPKMVNAFDNFLVY